jgi:hypothetical protein
MRVELSLAYRVVPTSDAESVFAKRLDVEPGSLWSGVTRVGQPALLVRQAGQPLLTTVGEDTHRRPTTAFHPAIRSEEREEPSVVEEEVRRELVRGSIDVRCHADHHQVATIGT